MIREIGRAGADHAAHGADLNGDQAAVGQIADPRGEIDLAVHRRGRARATGPDPKAKPERIFRLRLEAFDWNCAQHITPRFTEAERSDAMATVQKRLDALAAQNVALRTRLAAFEGDQQRVAVGPDAD